MQPGSFDVCPEQRNTLLGLVEQMQDLRTKYKDRINDCLQHNPPFPTQARINEDIAQFVRLVSYCLDVGDTEILDTWGIQLVSNDLRLLASQNYVEYKNTFKVLWERSEVDLEKYCMQKLVQFFVSLQTSP